MSAAGGDGMSWVEKTVVQKSKITPKQSIRQFFGDSPKISLKQLLGENFAPPDVPGMIIYDICLDTFCFPSVSEITKRIDWQRCLFIDFLLI